MRFRIEHPSEPGVFAVYGVGPSGAFVIVVYKGQEIDALEPGDDGGRPIHAVLETFVEWWWFSHREVAETLSALACAQPVPERLRAISGVVENMRLVTT